jgi:hypothetical protein
MSIPVSTASSSEARRLPTSFPHPPLYQHLLPSRFIPFSPSVCRLLVALQLTHARSLRLNSLLPMTRGMSSQWLLSLNKKSVSLRLSPLRTLSCRYLRPFPCLLPFPRISRGLEGSPNVLLYHQAKDLLIMLTKNLNMYTVSLSLVDPHPPILVYPLPSPLLLTFACLHHSLCPRYTFAAPPPPPNLDPNRLHPPRCTAPCRPLDRIV